MATGYLTGCCEDYQKPWCGESRCDEKSRLFFVVVVLL